MSIDHERNEAIERAQDRADRLEARVKTLTDALEWALRYGTFDVATDNPQHAHMLDIARAALRAGGPFWVP